MMPFMEHVANWVRQGILPELDDRGWATQFVAIIRNDLTTALACGNVDCLGGWAQDIFLLVPSVARGSVEAVAAWQAQGGVEGLIRDRDRDRQRRLTTHPRQSRHIPGSND